MNLWLNVLIGILLLALIVLIVIRLRLKRRLDSIDGMVGIIRNSAISGKVIGGEFTKVYKHPKIHSI